MIVLSIVITLVYLSLITGLAIGFNNIKVFKLKETKPQNTFSILIPFRNEANNLSDLLNSIDNLNYPNTHFEIIFIDDDSTDDSVLLIENHFKTKPYYNNEFKTDFKIIPNQRRTNSPKKDAITTAIAVTKYDWIITTDADCILPKFWLDCFDEFIKETNATCIAAPVSYIDEEKFLNRFQILDMLSLQGATIGGFGIKKPFLCNGANFGYKKSVFIELNGFQGNNYIASGDDIFLLEKISNNQPERVKYLNSEEAIVKTKSQNSWKSLAHQRIRWAAKTSAYKNWFGKLIGLIVFLMNLWILILVVFTVEKELNIEILSAILVLKFIADFNLINKSAIFFNQKKELKSFLLAFVIYPFFSVFIALLSLFKPYQWKGRYFNK